MISRSLDRTIARSIAPSPPLAESNARSLQRALAHSTAASVDRSIAWSLARSLDHSLDRARYLWIVGSFERSVCVRYESCSIFRSRDRSTTRWHARSLDQAVPHSITRFDCSLAQTLRRSLAQSIARSFNGLFARAPESLEGSVGGSPQKFHPLGA